MGYVTAKTTWPTAVQLDASVKELIDLFYTLADDKSSDAGPRLAAEVFTKDATMGSSAGTAQGTEAISHSRDNAWNIVASRHHTVLQVFVSDSAGRDLTLIGELTQVFNNGKELTAQFVAHLVVDAESHRAGKPRLSLMQVFADSAPFAAAAKA
ncbi:hypothetical protein LTR84_001581 [Exophiala bonariae]|uniref:SnoaL-like domain-containing protein n=1 Tax=Exophiala bonariae TaxID=1690606 RepID=A0AAV9NHI0_9EURO|nr:hypothetical protein LTR84_001581 [Exophiala bonariae]